MNSPLRVWEVQKYRSICLVEMKQRLYMLLCPLALYRVDRIHPTDNQVTLLEGHVRLTGLTELDTILCSIACMLYHACMVNDRPVHVSEIQCIHILTSCMLHKLWASPCHFTASAQRASHSACRKSSQTSN